MRVRHYNGVLRSIGGDYTYSSTVPHSQTKFKSPEAVTVSLTVPRLETLLAAHHRQLGRQSARIWTFSG